MRVLLALAATTIACSAPSATTDTAAANIRSNVCDVRAFGAKGDGVTNDTRAIQAAIDACSTVELSAGTFRSGTIRLGSDRTLRIDAGATLLGSQEIADYPDLAPPTNNSQLSNCKKALVYAEGANNVHLTGGGVIDGNGGLPAWRDSKEATRPMAVFFVKGDGVTIDGITVKNSAMWSVVQMETDNVAISNVTVDSTQGSTRDGIDIVDGHHVRIDHVTIHSEDDAICLKSGVLRGVDDLVVTNSTVASAGVANGLKIGTATYGSFTNITFDGIDIAHADKAAMAVESVDGSMIQNVAFRNIRFADVGTPFFLIVGDRGVRPAGAPRQVGAIDGVSFENITGRSPRHGWGSVVSGLVDGAGTHAIRNVRFTNVDVAFGGGATTVPATPAEYAGQYPDPNLWGNTPAAGFFLRHASGITFDHASFTVAPDDARPLVAAVDAADVTAPTCDVTFVVHADEPGDLALAGKTTGITLGGDPLGAWDPSAAVRVDATTLTAKVTLPQGANVAFKAIRRDGDQVTWERPTSGNRIFTVPNEAATTVDLTWQSR